MSQSDAKDDEKERTEHEMCSFYADKRYATVQPRTELLIS